jgi:hypothetical protein
VKWVRYTPWGDIILDAVDSDYVIIGCATIERLKHAAPRVFVKRLVLEPGNAAMNASQAAVGGGVVVKKTTTAVKKRPLDTFLSIPTNDTNTEKIDTGTTNVKKGRQYEYVDCGIVVNAIRSTFGKRTPDKLKPYIVRILAHCIALCGCDFTRGVSWFNGTAAFKNAGLLWPGLCASAHVDPDTDIIVMDPRQIAERVIGVLWKEVQFKKLCTSSVMQNADFETLFKELSTNTVISAFRRDRLVTPTDLCCLVRNANWCCFYWSDPERTPCSLNGGDYGFTQLKPGAKVQFDDNKALPMNQSKKIAGVSMLFKK